MHDNIGSRQNEDAQPATIPRFRAYNRPRTRDGWNAVVSFFMLFALTQPLFFHTVANRVTPWVLSLPFLCACLLIVYGENTEGPS